MMERTPSADEADQSIGHLEDERHVASPGSREYRNIPEYERGHREREEDRRQPEVRERTPPPVGQRAVADVSSSDEETGRHRIEIMMGRRKVILAWYKGASTEDIKTSIARRFALLPGTQWALMDQNYDEIIVSAGVPSGRYTLTVFS